MAIHLEVIPQTEVASATGLLDSQMRDRGFERVRLPQNLPGIFDVYAGLKEQVVRSCDGEHFVRSMQELDIVIVRLRPALRRVHARVWPDGDTNINRSGHRSAMLRLLSDMGRLIGRALFAKAIAQKLNCRARMPLMPETVQELDRRAKSLAGEDAICWLLFEPQWIVEEDVSTLVQTIHPDKDPVLVIQKGKGGPCWRVGGWDNDQEVIDGLMGSPQSQDQPRQKGV